MHFFAIFPQLFFLSPLSTTLLRVAAALVFFYLARYYYKNRSHLSQTQFIVVGSGIWIPIFSSVLSAVTALALLLGAYTQLFAILGALGALKGLLWRGRYPEFFVLTRIESALLLVICLSLIVTGAGAFAVDFPF